MQKLLAACFLGLITRSALADSNPCEEAPTFALIEAFNRPPLTSYSAKIGPPPRQQPSTYLRQLQLECAAYLERQTAEASRPAPPPFAESVTQHI